MDKKYLAIYFRMGMYNEDDNVPSNLIGFDCPFDDSPVLYAKNKEELEQKVREVYAGNVPKVVEKETESYWEGVDWEGIYPDVICDARGKIQSELYCKICSDERFNPDLIRYSFGRETLMQLWEREKWRWV